MHYSFCISPITLATIPAESCPIRLDTAFDKILDARSRFLPTLPYTHSYPPAQPFVQLIDIDIRELIGLAKESSQNPLPEYASSIVAGLRKDAPEAVRKYVEGAVAIYGSPAKFRV